MKKLLALVLALVMTLGLATVGTNAALSDTFKDADDINYEEAVAVMNAIGVLIGDDQGNFRADAYLTRGEAAKIIAYLRLGNKTAEALGASGTKFTDVPTSHWACKYIEYCAAEGIINGVGDNKFDPNGQLLTIDFAKMLLGALGYDAKIEGMTGADYRIFTSTLADRVGIFDGNSNAAGTSPVTRDEAALYAFNTIKSPLVEYTNKGGSISINGADISLGASNASYVVTTIASQQNISDRQLTNTNQNQQGGYTVEFGERYYSKLVRQNAFDDFARPAWRWTYDNKLIGTYVQFDKRIGSDYNVAVSGKTLYELIGGETLRNCDVLYFVDNRNVTETADPDATINKNNTDTFGATGNGVLTEVYKLDDAENPYGVIWIVSINTYLGQVTTAYNKTKNTTKFEVKAIDDNDYVAYDDTAIDYNSDVNADDVALVKDLALDDYVLVQLSNTNGTNYKIVTVKKPSKTETDMTVTKWSKSSEYLVTGGQQQDWSKKIQQEFEDYGKEKLDNNYDLYYDTYGFVIGALEVSAKKQYVFLSAFDLSGSNRTVKTANAFLIFLDGTTKDALVNVEKTNENIEKAVAKVDYAATEDYYQKLTDFDEKSGTEHYNKWFSYTVSGEGDSAVYTLKPVTYDTTAGDTYWATYSYKETAEKIKTVNPSFAKYDQDGTNSFYIYGNDDSVYMTAGLGDNTAGEDRAIAKVSSGPFTGVQNVSLKVSAAPTDWTNDTDFAYDNHDHNVFVVFSNTKSTGAKYAIGAIVFGKSGSDSTYLTYAVKEATGERKEGKYYYWEFQGIVDGELKTMTVKDTDNFGVIGKIAEQVNENMGFGKGIGYRTLFEVTYDKDGYITDAQLVYNDAGVDAWYTEAKFGNTRTADQETAYDNAIAMVDDLEDKTNALSADAKATYKLTGSSEDDFTLTDMVLTAKGNTLVIGDSNTDRGLAVVSGAKIWTVQYYESSKSVKAEEHSSFKEALADLEYGQSNGTATKFNGIISAALDKNGNAKWVVLKSLDMVTIKGSTSDSSSSTFSTLAISNDGVVYKTSVDAGNELTGEDLKGKWVEVYKNGTESSTPDFAGKYAWADDSVEAVTVEMLAQNAKTPTDNYFSSGEKVLVIIRATENGVVEAKGSVGLTGTIKLTAP